MPLVLTQLDHRHRPCVKSVEAITRRLGAQLEETPALSHFDRAERELVIAADGIFLPTREGKREVRCAVIHEPERSPAACVNLRKKYPATTESREDLMATACARVERRRPRGAVIAALGDGAEWFWAGYAQHLPRRVEILDFYHFSERLALIAQSKYPGDPGASQAWRSGRRKRCCAGDPSNYSTNSAPDLLAARFPDREQCDGRSV